MGVLPSTLTRLLRSPSTLIRIPKIYRTLLSQYHAIFLYFIVWTGFSSSEEWSCTNIDAALHYPPSVFSSSSRNCKINLYEWGQDGLILTQFGSRSKHRDCNSLRICRVIHKKCSFLAVAINIYYFLVIYYPYRSTKQKTSFLSYTWNFSSSIECSRWGYSVTLNFIHLK